MRKVINAVVFVPLAVIFIVFAVANRRLVTVSFDPFNTADPSVGLTLPLFVVLIATAMFGVLAGGLASWLRHRHWRREARGHEADARALRAELALWQQQGRADAMSAALSQPPPQQNYPALPGDNRAQVL